VQPHLSGATAEEEAILDPLFLEPAEIAQADLAGLIALGARIGLARGYAMCRCLQSESRPPDDVAGVLSSCAADEAGMLRDFSWYPSAERGPRPNEDMVRCLSDEALQRPELEDALRCELGSYQKDGQAWLDLCSIPHGPNEVGAWPGPPQDTCQNAQELSGVLEECRLTSYCADGTRVGGRCGGWQECPDESDERGCFDFVGRDMLRCGGEIIRPAVLCNPEGCGFELRPSPCDEARRDRFLCTDGSDVSGDVVCDRKDDCADGTDEVYCVR
jgi:hypothetical protein